MTKILDYGHNTRASNDYGVIHMTADPVMNPKYLTKNNCNVRNLHMDSGWSRHLDSIQCQLSSLT